MLLMVKVFKWYLEKGQPSKDNCYTFKLGRVRKNQNIHIHFLRYNPGGDILSNN